jgi:hypothetical protein
MQGRLGVWSKQVLQHYTVGRPILQTAVFNRPPQTLSLTCMHNLIVAACNTEYTVLYIVILVVFLEWGIFQTAKRRDEGIHYQ